MANGTKGDAPALRLTVPLSRDFRFTHEPLDAFSSERFIGRDKQLDVLSDRVLFSNGGAFLITGYRGVGKTSFVNQIIRKLEMDAHLRHGITPSRVVCVQLNLARPVTPLDLMFLLIRCLYLELGTLGVDRELDPAVLRDLKLAYQRTLMEFKETASSSNEFTLKGPAVETSGPTGLKAKFDSFVGYKRAMSQARETSYLPYLERAAEYDLIHLARRLQGAWRPRRTWWTRLLPRSKQPVGALKIVFVFDELDKIEELQFLDDLFSTLKNLFTTSGMTFLFVAGKDVQERWGNEIGRGDSIYESVFAYEAYLPCLWERASSICLHCLDNDARDMPELEVLWRFLAFQGRGVPRRVLRTFQNYIRWSGGRPHLALTPYEFRDAEYFAGLEAVLAPLRDRESTGRDRSATGDLGPEDDKRALGLYYLVDWILQRGTAEFTLAAAIEAYEKLSSKVVLSGLMAGEIRKLLMNLRQRGYIEIATTAAHKQFVRQNEQGAERYRLVRSARPEPEGRGATPAERAGQVGRYRVLGAIAVGGMGTVVRACDDDGDIVAVKYVQNPSPPVRQLFQNEARVLSEIEHAGIPKFRAFEETDELQVLAMELIDGVSLGQTILQRRTLPAEEAVRLVSSIVDSVAYLHDRGYVHGDIKPSNIMIDVKGRIYLTDFSTARRIDAPIPSVGLAGTPAYMAPELFRGAATSTKTDIYAVGVTLYEAICGRRPFSTDSYEDLVDRVKSAPIQPPSEFTSINPNLDELILRCLAREPQERPDSMRQLSKLLEEFPQSESLELRADFFFADLRSDESTKIPEFPQSQDPAGTDQSAKVEFGRLSSSGPATRLPQATVFPSKRTGSDKPLPPTLTESKQTNHAPVAAPSAATGGFEKVRTRRPEPASEFTRMFQAAPPSPVLESHSFVPIGGEKAWVETVDSQSGEVIRYPILGESLRIGRSSSVDVYVDDKASSRVHLMITNEQQQFSIMDMGSLNGALLNGKRLDPRDPIKLRDGDRITIGAWTATFRVT